MAKASRAHSKTDSLESLRAETMSAPVRPIGGRRMLRGGDPELTQVFASLLQERAARVQRAEQELLERDFEEEAALRFLALSSEQWEALSVLRAGFNEATDKQDQEAMHSFVRYAQEVLAGPREHPADAVTDELPIPPGGESLIEQVDLERRGFFERYFAAKAKSPFRTQADVARAAKLSPATVQAIESRQVKPHFGTIKKLATAFGVDVSQLVA